MVKTLLLFCATASLWAAGGPRIIYSKSFPGSVPPYVAITLERDGACEYKEAPDDDRPMKFKLAGSEAGDIFALAEKLQFFQRPLESPLKVANMGIKTFRYENGETAHEVKFNFSEDPDARLITDWFERMTETEQHRIHVERAVRFDKLGVNKALLQFQAAMERNRLVALDQFLPFLDRIANNQAYLNMARERAAHLAATIRAAAKPKSE